MKLHPKYCYAAGAFRHEQVACSSSWAVKARAQELDCPLLWWLTAEDNATAQALYDQIAERDSFRRYEVLLRRVT